MGRVGRFACVAIPFALTIACLVCLLIAGLAGVSNKSLYLFQIHTGNLSISSADLLSLATSKRDLSSSIIAATGGGSTATNITATDLGLADDYKISLWNYCSTTGGITTCSTPAFNWASNATNTTSFAALATSIAGVSLDVPAALAKALSAFSTLAKWTEVVYIIAAGLTVLEILVGVFAICSRVGSCCTWLISGFATVSVIAASVLATVMAATVVGTMVTVGKAYGITASINTSFLATTWMAAAFSLAAGLFWLFSACCCSAEASARKDKHRSRAGNGLEKPFGGYQRVHDPFQPTAYGGNQESGVHHGYSVPMGPVKGQRAGAYEPYSHQAV
jgi:hypothetical protein